MSSPKIMHGARALVQILDPNTNQPVTVGIFNNFSYGVNYDVQPAFILGRFSAAELAYTAMEPCQISAGAWRVIGHGAHVTAKLPKLADLLRHEYLEIQVVDRQTGRPIAKIHSVRPSGMSTNLTARQLEEMTCTYVGLLVDDEDTVNAELPGSADLP